LDWPEGTFFSIGSELDLETTAEAFGHRHQIGGNLRTDLLAGGRYQEVYEAAWRCLEIGFGLPGGYALMPACETPVTAPPLNVQALVDAARDFNREKGLT
jgi:uroporphyrinogen decarboxylase